MGGYLKYFEALKNPLFLIASILFFLNQWLESADFSHFLMRRYLDDLLVVPVILPIAETLMRVVYRNEKLKLDLGMIITTVVLLAILFELILPMYSLTYTSDVYDVLCYAVGGTIYHFFNPN